MQKINFWQKNTDKTRVHQGLLVEDKETKFIVKVGQYQIEYHYPKSSYDYEIVEEKWVKLCLLMDWICLSAVTS